MDPLDPDATILAMAISPFDPSIMLASTSPLLNKDGTAKNHFTLKYSELLMVPVGSNYPPTHKAVADISFDPAHSNFGLRCSVRFRRAMYLSLVNSGLIG